MSKQPQYTESARGAFTDYLDEKIDREALVEKLRAIESQASEELGGEDAGLWFRFFEGDTLATTISDIERDLSAPSHPNSKLLRSGIALGLQSGKLEVHYS